MVDSPIVARNKLAAAHRFGPAEPEHEALLRANLATSNADAAIRLALADVPLLSDGQIGHLVGLVCNYVSQVDGETSSRIEAYVRQAVRECRERLAEGGAE